MTDHTSIPLVNRRCFLQTTVVAGLSAMAFSTSSARANDVDWLSEVQRPPTDLPASVRKLSPLLVKPDGSPITTLTEWTIERERLRRAWLEFLGPMPAERPAVKLEVLREDKASDISRQLVRYESEVGLPVEGYLLRPPPSGTPHRRPAIVLLHPTNKDTIDEMAGLKGVDSRHFGLRLARRGFIVFCPRCFLWQNAENYQQAVDNFKKRHPRTLGMHKMLWDAMRGVDVLTSLGDEVDPRRIGATGHSLGAKETFYLAAFDERIRAAVASEGGIGFSFTNWDASWYLGPGFKAEGFPLDHHQLLALIAPRPFLILAGESGPGAADGDRTWPYVSAALPVNCLHGSPARLGLYNHRQGHTLSDPTFERLAEWLASYLTLDSR